MAQIPSDPSESSEIQPHEADGTPPPRTELFGLADAASDHVKARRQRERIFPAELFADPAWDILLDLFANTVRGNAVSISDACIASAVPSTTALRWIGRLHELGLLERLQDPRDTRRVLLRLTDPALDKVAGWVRQHLA